MRLKENLRKLAEGAAYTFNKFFENSVKHINDKLAEVKAYNDTLMYKDEKRLKDKVIDIKADIRDAYDLKNRGIVNDIVIITPERKKRNSHISTACAGCYETRMSNPKPTPENCDDYLYLEEDPGTQILPEVDLNPNPAGGTQSKVVVDPYYQFVGIDDEVVENITQKQYIRRTNGAYGVHTTGFPKISSTTVSGGESGLLYFDQTKVYLSKNDSDKKINLYIDGSLIENKDDFDFDSLIELNFSVSTDIFNWVTIKDEIENIYSTDDGSELLKVRVPIKISFVSNKYLSDSNLELSFFAKTKDPSNYHYTYTKVCQRSILDIYFDSNCTLSDSGTFYDEKSLIVNESSTSTDTDVELTIFSSFKISPDEFTFFDYEGDKYSITVSTKLNKENSYYYEYKVLFTIDSSHPKLIFFTILNSKENQPMGNEDALFIIPIFNTISPSSSTFINYEGVVTASNDGTITSGSLIPKDGITSNTTFRLIHFTNSSGGPEISDPSSFILESNSNYYSKKGVIVCYRSSTNSVGFTFITESPKDEDFNKCEFFISKDNNYELIPELEDGDSGIYDLYYSFCNTNERILEEGSTELTFYIGSNIKDKTFFNIDCLIGSEYLSLDEMTISDTPTEYKEGLGIKIGDNDYVITDITDTTYLYEVKIPLKSNDTKRPVVISIIKTSKFLVEEKNLTLLYTNNSEEDPSEDSRYTFNFQIGNDIKSGEKYFVEVEAIPAEYYIYFGAKTKYIPAEVYNFKEREEIVNKTTVELVYGGETLGSEDVYMKFRVDQVSILHGYYYFKYRSPGLTRSGKRTFKFQLWNPRTKEEDTNWEYRTHSGVSSNNIYFTSTITAKDSNKLNLSLVLKYNPKSFVRLSKVSVKLYEISNS